MVTKKIEFRKIRDFGENITDTIGFIKQEFKPLLKPYVLIAGAFILMSSLFLGLFVGDIYGNVLESVVNDTDPLPQFSGLSIGSYLVFLILTPITIAAMNTVISCYIKLYREKNNNSPAFEEVWREVTKYFGIVLLFSFLYVFAVVIGLFLCLLPGIYLAIVLLPYAQVIIFENERSVGSVWNRCVYLGKENFWMTLLLYILLSMIVSFASSAIGMLVAAAIGLASYFITKDISSAAGILYGIIYFFSYLFYIILLVSLCLHYFNLAEKKDGAGLLQRIQNMGGSNDEHSHMEERY